MIAVVFHPSLTVFFPLHSSALSINRHFLRKCHLYIGIMPKWSIVSFEGKTADFRLIGRVIHSVKKMLASNWRFPPRPFSNFPSFSNCFFSESEAAQKSTVQRFWWGTPPHRSREEGLPPKTFEDKCVAWHSGFCFF